MAASNFIIARLIKRGYERSQSGPPSLFHNAKVRSSSDCSSIWEGEAPAEPQSFVFILGGRGPCRAAIVCFHFERARLPPSRNRPRHGSAGASPSQFSPPNSALPIQMRHGVAGVLAVPGLKHHARNHSWLRWLGASRPEFQVPKPPEKKSENSRIGP